MKTTQDARNRELARLMLEGDSEARHLLVHENTKMVHKIASWYLKSTIGISWRFTYTDLFQEGVVALIEAIDSYDPSKGALSTLAVPRIKIAILRYIRDSDLARIPDEQHTNIRNLTEAESQLYAANQKPPTAEELACRCGLSTELVEVLRSRPQVSSFLGAILQESGKNSDSKSSLDTPDPRSDTPEEALTPLHLEELASAVSSALPERQAACVLLTCGFDQDGIGRTHAEVAKMLGISRECVGQHARKGTKALQACHNFRTLANLN